MSFKIYFLSDNPRWMCLALGICGYLGLAEGQNPKPPLITLFEWRQLEFDYESERARQSDINSGFYQPNIAAPIDADVYYRGESIWIYVRSKPTTF